MFITGGLRGQLFKKGLFITSFSDDRSPMKIVKNSSLPSTKFVNYAVEVSPTDLIHLKLPSLPDGDFYCAVPPCSTPSAARERDWLGCICNTALTPSHQNAKMISTYVSGQGLFIRVHLLRDVYVPPGKTVQILISYGERYNHRLRLKEVKKDALTSASFLYGVGKSLINCSGCFTARPKRETFNPCPNGSCPTRRASRVKARGS